MKKIYNGYRVGGGAPMLQVYYIYDDEDIPDVAIDLADPENTTPDDRYNLEWGRGAIGVTEKALEFTRNSARLIVRDLFGKISERRERRYINAVLILLSEVPRNDWERKDSFILAAIFLASPLRYHYHIWRIRQDKYVRVFGPVLHATAVVASILGALLLVAIAIRWVLL